MRALHAALPLVGNAKWITNSIGCAAETLERPEKVIEVNAVVSSGVHILTTTKDEANMRATTRTRVRPPTNMVGGGYPTYPRPLSESDVASYSRGVLE